MASTTTLAETAQALFCAIRDDLTNAEAKSLFKENTYTSFKKKYEDLKGAGAIQRTYRSQVKSSVMQTEVEKFITDDDSWYISSKNIADELFRQIGSISQGFSGDINWQDVVYYHAKNANLKNTIQQMFKTCNASSGNYFSSIDRWCPADIYFASKKGMEELNRNKKIETFKHLNSLISDLIQQGDLLPVSLKKEIRKVTIEKVNFNRQEELEKIKEYEYYGVSDKKTPVRLNETKEAKIEKYFEVKIDKTGKESLMFRFSSSSKSFRIEKVLIGTARGGSINSIQAIKNIFNKVDAKFSTEFIAVFNDFKSGKITDTEAKNKTLASFIKHFDSNRDKADDLVKELLEYAGSRTESSSPYIIAK